MVVAATLVMVPLGVLFNFSGLVVMVEFHAIFFIFVRPLLTSICRRINKVVAELWWLKLIELHMDSETSELLAIIGATLIGLLDESLLYTCWSIWFSHYIFLEGSWAKDESTLNSCFRRLEDFPIPFWLGLFLEAAQQYAASTALPVPRFCFSCKFVPAIYDCAVATPTNKPSPTILSIFARQISVARLQNSRHLMLELPETGDGIAQWCRDDVLLENYFTKGTFSNLQLQRICRPKKSKLVVMFWSCLTIYGSVKFFQRSKLLSSWKGLAASAAFLALVTILMQSQRDHHHKIAENLQHR
ncbi:hypothetical protein UlMin_029803 [Ulmus minor]